MTVVHFKRTDTPLVWEQDGNGNINTLYYAMVSTSIKKIHNLNTTYEFTGRKTAIGGYSIYKIFVTFDSDADEAAFMIKHFDGVEV